MRQSNYKYTHHNFLSHLSKITLQAEWPFPGNDILNTSHGSWGEGGINLISD